MGLLSIFERRTGSPADSESVASARTRARRRLIGAVVLVAAGVIGFPLVFDTAPRPVASDIAIEIPRKDAVPPLATPPARSAASGAARRDSPAAQAVAEPGPQAPAAPAKSTVAKVEDKPVEQKPQPVPDKPEKPAPAAAKRPEAAPAKPPVEAARAQAALEGRAPEPKADSAAAESAGRFVVQVGAFSEADSAREARARVEKLGLKTYTQVVETNAGKRIRVRIGPYSDRADAEKTADKLKQAGLAPAVLTL